MNTDTELPTKLPAVPEAVLKRRIRRNKYKSTRIQVSLKARAAGYKKRTNTFKRAENLVKTFRLKERDERRIKRQIRKNDNTNTANNRVAFVIRTKGENKMASIAKNILIRLNLKVINSGRFILLTEATVNMLRVVEPYVTWGCPDLKSVRDLIFKRGFANVDKKRLPINGNTLIEEKLGQFGIICIEDLVHEIFTVGSNFQKVNTFLWPFRLNTPANGWREKLKHFNKGGRYGDRGDEINELISRMV
ncbi:hypothetical protein HCN44_005570 [Aphidius gifuensis]|uniref:60S ribosomal protein L7 n=1 Tax=Aphidius gifuensis TaxID=684658 RepID=A0A835CXB4_APHGI|nr:60S ribosomal protein L7-like [Aphidius gifuensis]KAF7997293.1 hypothetical protein HCN44_005570 [Aphidius gifuensis]